MSSLPVLGLMNQQIGVKRTIRDDNSFYHEEHTVGFETYPARVEIRPSISYGSNGVQLPSYATVYTIGQINRDDDILLPDGTIRKALSVEWAVDGKGMFSHSVVSV